MKHIEMIQQKKTKIKENETLRRENIMKNVYL